MNEIHYKINRAQRVSFAVGVLFLVLCVFGVAFTTRAFFISYLIAFIFWFGLALGCFNAALIHYLTGGHWGNVTRRFLEAGFMTLPLMAVFFIPILFGLHDLYAWARPAAVAADKILQQKAIYENSPGFLLRAILFFAVWLFVACRLRKWSLQQDLTDDPTPGTKLRRLGGPAIVIVPLTATFAFVDWIMSIEPAWFSTVFAVILLSAGVLIAFALIILLLAWLQPHPPLHEAVTPKHFLDLGNLLLASVMFWTYIAFSQFLIIYSGNQPHEIGWYLHRVAGNWKWLLCFIALFHFFIPFFVLLFRAAKKNVRVLATISLLIFLVNALEIFWTIAPTFYPDGITVHWTDFAAWLGIGGIWLAVFAAHLKRHPLLAQNLSPTETVIHETSNAR